MQEIFDKIIEKLESEAKRWEDSGTEYEDKCEIAVGRGLRNAIKIVKQEAEEHVTDINVGNNGWIPCSERLPTTEEYQRGNGRFLVTDGNRTYEAEFDIYESHTFGKSRMATEWFITDKCVTHWQNEPLPPQPYQPKGE